MKRFLVLAAMTLIAGSSFASSKTQTVAIAEPLVFGSTELMPGNYRVTWEGNGPIVHVTLTRGKVSATADAKLVTAENTNAGVTYTADGARKIVNEIDLQHVSLLLKDAHTDAD
ncbi:MAG TPA: hypothetical protein VHX37_07245 [Acidobacteriaceae bacterium]|jgi:hypothetical protein|nr:hypothetical protein [Acidobacteriaceae bacterium]